MTGFDDAQALRRLRDHYREQLSRPLDTTYADDGIYAAPDSTFSTPPSDAASLPPAQAYAGGGSVHAYDRGGNVEITAAPGVHDPVYSDFEYPEIPLSRDPYNLRADDYGERRFSRTPEERRIARERRIADWKPERSDEWDRFITRHRGNPLMYALDAASRLDNMAGAASSGNPLRDIFDILNPIQSDLQQEHPGWGSRIGDATLSVANMLPGEALLSRGIKPVTQFLGPMLGDIAASVGQELPSLAPQIPGAVRNMWNSAKDTLNFWNQDVPGYRSGGSEIKASIKKIGNQWGKTQADRAERAADEGLLDRFTGKGLQNIFDPTGNGLYMSMPPGDFQDYAVRLPSSALSAVPYPRWETMAPPALRRKTPPQERTLDSYLDFMADRIQRRGLDTAADSAALPTLWLSKNARDLTEINSHEGRHRMMTMDRLGDPAALVRLQPANSGELFRPSMDSDPAEMVDRLLGKYFPRGGGTMVVPEQPELLPRLPRAIYGEPFKDGGGVRFIRNLREHLGPEKSAALDKIAKVTDRTKNEALIYGMEGVDDPLSAIVRGNATSVPIPEWEPRFVGQARGNELPWFSAHTHPNSTLAPSLGDLQVWSRYPDYAGDMLIHAWPQRSVLQLPGRAPAKDMDFATMAKLGMEVRPDERVLSSWRGLLDFAKAHGAAPTKGSVVAPYMRELESLPLLDAMSRRGMPVQMDASHVLPNTSIRAEDVYPELMKFYRGAGSDFKPFDFDKGGSVLSRLIKGKPAQFKLPSGEVHPADPIPAFEDVASKFAAKHGNAYPIDEYPAFNEDRARRIADAYAAMEHNPSDPAVRRAYDALVDETMDQYRALKNTGVDFSFLRPGEADPYAASPALGYLDIVNNGRLKVFPTESGFGTLNAAADDNPLLRRVGRVGDLDNATANDAFRVVHDALGHYGPGNPFFRHQGEERAWLLHGRSYSPDALPAATSETRGQNSWVNFGPHGERNRRSSGADTVFADQKTGIMPSWTWEDFALGGPVQAFKSGKLVQSAEEALKSWRTRKAEALEKQVKELNVGKKPSDEFTSPPVSPRLQTVAEPERVMFPGIYKDPRDIISEAKASWIPDPGKEGAMYQLFGHDRQSLDALSQEKRYLDAIEPPEMPWSPGPRPRGAAVTEQIQTPRNVQRIQDALGLALQDPELRSTRSWYELGPLWDMMDKFGLASQKRPLNTRMGVMSPGSDPPKEINRGFFAHYLAPQGRTEDLSLFGVQPVHKRPDHFPDDLSGLIPHPYTNTAHMPNLRSFEATGKLSSDRHKVPTYIMASDPVWEYGGRPVADAHFTRFLGYPDVRTGRAIAGNKKELSPSEYNDMLPWWSKKIAEPLGMRERDAQALMWNVGGPQTGVSYIGAPKLEMISDQIAAAAKRLGIPLEEAAYKMLSGESPGFAEGGSVDDDFLIYHPFMFSDGGSVDDDMLAYQSQYYEHGGPVKGFFC